MTWKHLDAFPRMRGHGAIYRLNAAMSFEFGGGKQPSGARQSHIFAKDKIGGMRQNKLPKQKRGVGEKKALIAIFHRAIPSLEDQKRHGCIHIYYPDRKCQNEVK